MLNLTAGSPVKVRTAKGEWVDRRAIGGVVDGRDFAVVWVCTDREWSRSQTDGRAPDALPWPVEDVIPRA